jgi:hypothetical protein
MYQPIGSYLSSINSGGVPGSIQYKGNADNLEGNVNYIVKPNLSTTHGQLSYTGVLQGQNVAIGTDENLGVLDLWDCESVGDWNGNLGLKAQVLTNISNGGGEGLHWNYPVQAGSNIGIDTTTVPITINGLGSGGGITSITAGSSIGVDATVPSAPVVSVNVSTIGTAEAYNGSVVFLQDGVLSVDSTKAFSYNDGSGKGSLTVDKVYPAVLLQIGENVSLLDKASLPGTQGQVLSSDADNAGASVLWVDTVGSVVSGSNISVDSTAPSAPVVNFDLPPIRDSSDTGGAIPFTTSGATPDTVLVYDNVNSYVIDPNTQVNHGAGSIVYTSFMSPKNLYMNNNNISDGGIVDLTYATAILDHDSLPGTEGQVLTSLGSTAGVGRGVKWSSPIPSLVASYVSPTYYDITQIGTYPTYLTLTGFSITNTPSVAGKYVLNVSGTPSIDTSTNSSWFLRTTINGDTSAPCGQGYLAKTGDTLTTGTISFVGSTDTVSPGVPNTIVLEASQNGSVGDEGLIHVSWSVIFYPA